VFVPTLGDGTIGALRSPILFRPRIFAFVAELGINSRLAKKTDTPAIIWFASRGMP
jgi:hypothetical protein